jgi:4,5-DOPA dioxygenase extradiol
MDRRTAMKLAAATAAASLAACRKGKDDAMTAHDQTATMPALFLAHGAPPLLDDQAWRGELGVWARALPRPHSILMLSAHWEARPATLGATRTAPLVYDFYGFPQRYYETTYAAPGAPELAARVRGLLRGAGLGVADDPDRGLDHGAWVPLLGMYPDADVPVLQASLPGLAPKELLAFGRALAPLRREGVLVVGSGFLTHNMRSLGERTTPSWASEFDAWVAEALSRGDLDALAAAEAKAPAFRLAHPREEHFAPVLAAAAAAAGEKVSFPISGYWKMAPAFTRRSVQFG